MKSTTFPGCCSARIIAGFCQDMNAGDIAVWDTDKGSISKRDIMKKLAEHEQMSRMQGAGIMTAITTSKQTTGIKALKEAGWSCSGFTSKDHAPATALALWWKFLGEEVEVCVD